MNNGRCWRGLRPALRSSGDPNDGPSAKIGVAGRSSVGPHPLARSLVGLSAAGPTWRLSGDVQTDGCPGTLVGWDWRVEP